MSELDIELQKQTQDISVTEMMQETDIMQKTLKGNESITEKILIGEDRDGK